MIPKIDPGMISMILGKFKEEIKRRIKEVRVGQKGNKVAILIICDDEKTAFDIASAVLNFKRDFGL